MASLSLSLALLLAITVILVHGSDGQRHHRRCRPGTEAVQVPRRNGSGTRRRCRPVQATDPGTDVANGDDNSDNTDTETTGDALDSRGMRRAARRQARRRGGRQGGHHGRSGHHHRTLNEQEQLERLRNLYASSNNNFTMDVYRGLSNDNENFVFSPVSIFTALSMLIPGAGGETKRQLLSGLYVRYPVHPAFAAYNETLPRDEDDDAILKMANAVYVRENVEIKQRYSSMVYNFYGTNVSRIASENPEQAINTWVAERTMNQITDLLEQGTIDANTMVMLLNAVYFKGTWKDAFDTDDTALTAFNVPVEGGGSNPVQVNMMQRRGRYAFKRSDDLGALVLELPYKGERFALYLIMPDNTLEELENSLTGPLLNASLNDLNDPTQVYVTIPKFKLDTGASLQPLLENLGMRKMFSNRAKFRKMSTNRRLKVTQVQHRAIIEIDEEGTTASAATSVRIGLTSIRIETLTFDRPFLFVLRDKDAGVNLFMGRYVNPQGDGFL